MCTDTIPVLAYVKIELFFADICYYQRINPKPITDMAKKIAEQLIDTLAESGVERIYAVTGDSLNEVNEAVRKNNKIKWIHVRHEETGAYAAAAEAQLTGRPGCCAGSSGPGHVHLINGLYDAQRSGAPVIAIASTIPSREFGTEYFQETNTIKLFMSMPIFLSAPVLLEGLGTKYAGSAAGVISTLQLLGAVLIPTYILTPIAGDNYSLLFMLASICMVIMFLCGLLLPQFGNNQK